MWPRREVRDHAELNQPSVSHGPVTAQCPERGRVDFWGLLNGAMGRETFVQVGRWREVRVMGFPVGSQADHELGAIGKGETPDPDLDLDIRTQC
jgi:hypothetical protein